MHRLPSCLIFLPPFPGEVGFTALLTSDLGREARGSFCPSFISLNFPSTEKTHPPVKIYYLERKFSVLISFPSMGLDKNKVPHEKMLGFPSLPDLMRNPTDDCCNHSQGIMLIS